MTALKPLFSWRSAIVESELDADTKHVALTLSLHMNERGGSCFPSLETLAKETSRSKKTVVRCLRSLRSQGWLTVRAGGGRGRTSTYTAVVPETVSLGNSFQEESVSLGNRLEQETVSEGNSFPAVNGFPGKPEDVRPRSKTNPNPLAPAAREPAHRRRRDPLWDALAAEVGEPATRSERGRLNAALAELREIGATAEQIRARCAAYRSRWSVDLTATGLVANWTLLERSPPPKRNGRGVDLDALFAEINAELRAEAAS